MYKHKLRKSMASSPLLNICMRLPLYVAIPIMGIAPYFKHQIDEQNIDRLNRVIAPIIVSRYGTTKPYVLYDIPVSSCTALPHSQSSEYSKRAVSIQIKNTTLGDYCLETILDSSVTLIPEIPIYTYVITPLIKK